MAQSSKKQSVEERTAYLKDLARLDKQVTLVEQNQKRLKQERISCFKQTGNHCLKRSNDNDDELSVVSASKRPKVIQGHSNFETSSHWNTSKNEEDGGGLRIFMYWNLI